MGMKSKFKRFFELEDDVTEIEEYIDEAAAVQEESTEGRRRSKGQNVVSLQSIQQTAKVILHEPRTYDEAQDIADHLKNRKAVIINLQRISHEQAKRIVDFLSGTVYAIGGDIQKLGANIFLCTPDNVDVSGTITEMFEDRFDA
ncbi:cell division protein SepF [Alkalihalobacillus sp. LMS39]|uniref:cell division protein SepF n=1 Tax=Alkalihalobacillus sp. LMS39 TaxID=2924032 RepID=UPI001FB24CD2|nr:cell division protein SepF [Alkalihalobacillus sp. LMS39]UOE92914.1 cell division protein SepF [Alkalihalobacillus sp. LMS39]